MRFQMLSWNSEMVKGVDEIPSEFYKNTLNDIVPILHETYT